jgi:hypothetical protein
VGYGWMVGKCGALRKELGGGKRPRRMVRITKRDDTMGNGGFSDRLHDL